MNTISTLQYMALSSLAYSQLDNAEGLDIGDLIRDSDNGVRAIRGYRDANGNVTPSFSALATLSTYTLISFQSNTASGFAAAAFQAPAGPNGEPGEIIFTFRGTEPTTLPDLAADVAIFMQDAYNTLSSHLDDAKAFVSSILSNPMYSEASYGFTGYSLGGAVSVAHSKFASAIANKTLKTKEILGM